MSWRMRSVRRRILLLAIVPVLSLIGVYTFYTSIAARDAINLARAGTLKVQPTVPAGNILGSRAEGIHDADSLESGRGGEVRLNASV